MHRAICLALLLCANASAGRRKHALPCWVSAPCAPYSADAFLRGVGSGVSPQAAGDAARAEIAKTFSVRIQQTETSIKDAFQSKSQGEKFFSSTHRLNVTTQAETSRQLQDVQVVAQHQRGELFYALAVLDRPLAAERVRAEVAELERQLSQPPPSGVEGVRWRARGLAQAERLAFLCQELSVLESSAVQPRVAYADQLAGYLSSRAALRITVDADAPYLDAISQGVGAQGLRVAPGSDPNPDLQLVAVVTQSQAPASAGFLKISLRATVLISQGEAQLRSLDYQASAASQQADKALRIARDELIRQLAEVGAELAEELE